MVMKEKFDKVLDIALRVILVTLFVFGSCQFLVVGIATLFGVVLGIMQYVASVVLFGLGILCLIGWTRIEEE